MGSVFRGRYTVHGITGSERQDWFRVIADLFYSGFFIPVALTMAALYRWRTVMSFDNSNAELGIFISHSKAARERLGHAKGFERQHDWSISYLDERIFGMFVMFVLVILIAAWAFDIQPLVRYAVTIVAGAVFVYCKSMVTKRKKDLDALRKRQLEEYSRAA